MGDNSKDVKIDKFDGSNFNLWKFKVKLLLDDLDLWEFADGTATLPDQPNEAQLLAYHKSEKKTMAKICLHLADPQLQLVKDCRTPAAVWRTLCSYYEKKNLANKLFLRRQFFTVSMAEGQDILEHINRVRSLAGQLEAVDIEVTEDDLVMTLLSSLPSSYENLIVALESRGDDLSLEFVIARLLHEDTKRSSRQEQPSVTGDALLAGSGRGTKGNKNHKGGTSNKGPGRGRGRGRGTNDNQGGARATSDGTGGVGNGSGSGGGVRLACYVCGSVEHRARSCPKRHGSVGQSVSGSGRGEQSANPSEEVPAPNLAPSVDEQVLAAGSTADDSWYVDSGATAHMCHIKEQFSEFQPFASPRYIQLGDNHTVEAVGSGKVKMVADGGSEFTVTDALYVPKLRKNLLSVTASTEKGAEVKFTSKGCTISRNNQVVARGASHGKLYRLACTVICMMSMASVGDGLVPNAALWHQRFGHLNMRSLTTAHRLGLVDGLDGFDWRHTDSECAGCLVGKMHRVVPKGPGTRSDEVLGLVHTDVCGPMQKESLGRARYFLILVDDASRYTTVYPIRQKSDSLEKFREFHKAVTTQHGVAIKVLRSDRGGEFTSAEFAKYCRENGIQRQTTLPETPEQNGVAERMNRTVVESARTMLLTAKLPVSYWAEAVNTAVYVRNRCPTTAVNGKTPFEVWNGRKPDVSHLRVFGCLAYAHVPDSKRRKWDAKATPCRFVGYCVDSKGYKLIALDNRQVINSRDVVFYEDKFQRVSECGSEDEIEHWMVPEDEVHAGIQMARIPEPKTYRAAMKGPYAEQWQAAMDSEYQSLIDCGTWDLVEIPEGRTAIDAKWTFKVKYLGDGSVERFKARLVAKGFTQEAGVDYNEVFSPVACMDTIRLILAIANEMDMEIHQMDVQTAFLNGDLDEEIYLMQPEGYAEPGKENLVCRLRKSLYGLKQAARQWNTKIDAYLKKVLGYKACEADPCVYIRGNIKEGPVSIVTVYVDDLILIDRTEQGINDLKAKLSEGFKMKDLGQLGYCLGIQISRDRDLGVLKMVQRKYIAEILHTFQMDDCKKIPTPMDSSTDLNDEESLEEGMVNTYQKAVGMLVYATTATRPDLAVSVRYASQAMAKPTKAHWVLVKRILRYLQGTQEYGIAFRKDGKPGLVGYVDSDWAGDRSDRKSTTGWCFQYRGGPISWQSRKQECISLSSTEAEYVAACHATQECVWLRRLLTELGVVQSEPTTLKEDNQGCIALSKNPVSHKRSKHIDVKYHFVREMADKKEVRLEYCPTAENTADILTKPLDRIKFEKLRSMLGVQNCGAN